LNDKSVLIEQVNNIKTKGSTNLMGGLDQGTELLINNENQIIILVYFFFQMDL